MQFDVKVRLGSNIPDEFGAVWLAAFSADFSLVGFWLAAFELARLAIG
jgi:hypothetical protein